MIPIHIDERWDEESQKRMSRQRIISKESSENDTIIQKKKNERRIEYKAEKADCERRQSENIWV